jgi:hypothetical protein
MFAPLVSIWLASHGIDHDSIFDRTGNSRTAITMPTPFAVLCSRGHWDAFAFPLAYGRLGRGLGLGFVKHLLLAFQVPAVDAAALDAFENQELTTDMILRIADCLRTRDENVAAHIVWLEARRIHMLLAAARLCRSAYEMDFLVSCLLESSLLRNVSKLGEAVERAISIATRDPVIRDHLLHEVRKYHAIPSATTIRRHHLTLHMAFCLAQQKQMVAFEEGSGFVAWRTVDGSPQGGFDWVLHGARKIQVKDLVLCFRDAQRLHDVSLLPQQQKELISKLAPHMCLEQGVPTAVGSGKMSVKRKLHAVTHSERLHCPSWKSTVASLNSTFTWTGDLGTESGMRQFKGRVQMLFGDWVTLEDNRMVAPSDIQQPEFDFEDDDAPASDGAFEFEPEEDGAQANVEDEPAPRQHDAPGRLVQKAMEQFRIRMP